MSADKKTAAARPLKYIGDGHFAPGLPMRDLTAEEVEKRGGETRLIKTGLYELFAKGQEPAVVELPETADNAGPVKKGG